MMLFQNRTDAGYQLTRYLQLHAGRPRTVILALPRGGVPVAAEVANRLNLPLDVLVVRKLGAPGSQEMAIGAIAPGNIQYLNQDLIQRLNLAPEAIDYVIQQEQRELARREEAYRDNLPPLDLHAQSVILIDDGLATGATIQAAIRAVKQQQPRKITVAVPVAAPEICRLVGTKVDTIVCAETPHPFNAVGLWYREFSQVSDEEVKRFLKNQCFVS